MTQEHPITPPPPHLLKKFSAQAQDEAKKRNGAGYLKTFATLCIKWAVDFQPTPNDRQVRSLEITPPPELVVEWADTIYQQTECDDQRDLYVATQAARWGADQELEACCEWADETGWTGAGSVLRRLRRPKPPSLKELAIAELELLRGDANAHGLGFDAPAIRRALESLPD
jgi:hypothetical protein